MAALYREHHAFVRRVLLRLGMAQELDDAVQEVFLVVHRRLDAFEGRSSERTWLYAVAVRVASTMRRSRRREQARRDRAGDQMHGTTQYDPEAQLSEAEAQALLHALLEQLDEDKRTVLVLADVEGVRVPEISRILGVNVRTVHSRLRLARERFEAAARRHRERERGRMWRSSLRAKTLAQRCGDPGRPSPAVRQRTWALLAVRLQRSDAPAVAQWQSLRLGPSVAAPFMGPMALTVVVGVGVLTTVAVAMPQRVPADAEVVVASAPPPSASAGDEPLAPRASLMPAVEPMSAAAPMSGDATPTPAPAGRGGPHDTKGVAAASPSSMVGSSPPPDAAPSDLEAETRLLERARGALRRGRTAEVVAALDEHARDFGDGVLAKERRSTRLRALCVSGQPARAKTLARRWAEQQPAADWPRRLAAACGE